MQLYVLLLLNPVNIHRYGWSFYVPQINFHFLMGVDWWWWGGGSEWIRFFFSFAVFYLVVCQAACFERRKHGAGGGGGEERRCVQTTDQNGTGIP